MVLNIAVIGSGSWGTALANLLSIKGNDVKVWGRNIDYMKEINKTKINRKYLPNAKLNEILEFSSDIDYVLKDCEIIVFAVASQAVKKVLEKYKNLIGNQVIVNVAKGIDIESLKTISQIVKEILPENRYVVLSGPSHAEEVSLKMPTTIVSASEKREDAEFIQDLFTTDYLRVYSNPDVIGVEVAGSLKNIIAIGAGISDGLGYGDNAKAALMTRGILEIAKLGMILGGKEDTFKGLTGIGDLIVTCTSMHSRNRKCGILLGKGKSLEEAVKEIGMVVEGASTIKAAYKLAEKHDVYMPITKELYRILYENKDPRDSVDKLMLRRNKHEFEDLVHEDDWN
ncbi:NAD(P)H-dependent glycerol-3-phosphate dehydrogenase [Clostridiaceae bacterium HSG29]|nr:NAD(P)H-dependent glycerol-3-phosphate dehydrogenase [Clostridiaceae bacterium HSG29]